MAIVVPHLTRPSVVMRLAGALAVLEEQGYDTVVCNVDTPQQRDHHLAALTKRHRADGVIVVSLRLSRQQLASFQRSGVPLVTIGVLAPGVPQTVTDDVTGGRLATEHLLSLGHRRIGFVGDTARRRSAANLGVNASQYRLSGYRQALAAAGVDYDPALVRRGPYGAVNSEALAAELLARCERPSAIFATSDTQAMGVLTAADRCGLAVPGQLSVIGFDDIESAGLLGLSTVRQPLERSGADGASRLCALLRGERVRPLRQQLALEVVRRSRLRFPGKGVLIGMALLIAIFPQIALVTPLFNIERSIGLFNTWLGLIIPYVAFGLPLAIYILSAFFREIPWELEKAAKVDGATPFQAFIMVIAPLAAPGMVTTAILVFLACWNDFLFEELAQDAGRADAAGTGETIAARLDAATRIAEGQDAELWVDARPMHIFDPATGRNLSLAGGDGGAPAI
ncbi:MAG: substrate-binding domain-containing protein [Streptosporangiaceae bacterium]